MRILTCIIFLLLPFFASAQLQPIGQFLGKGGVPINEYVDRNDPRTEEISLLLNYYSGEIPAEGYSIEGEVRPIRFMWKKDEKVLDTLSGKKVPIHMFESIKVGDDSLIVNSLIKKNYAYRWVGTWGGWEFFETLDSDNLGYYSVYFVRKKGDQNLLPLLKKRSDRAHSKDYFHCNLMNEIPALVSAKKSGYFNGASKQSALFKLFEYSFKAEHHLPTYFNEHFVQVSDSIKAQVIMKVAFDEEQQFVERYYNKKGQLLEETTKVSGLDENRRYTYLKAKAYDIGKVLQSVYSFPNEGVVRRKVIKVKKKQRVFDYFPNGQLHYEFMVYESGYCKFLQGFDQEGKGFLVKGKGREFIHDRIRDINIYRVFEEDEMTKSVYQKGTGYVSQLHTRKFKASEQAKMVKKFDEDKIIEVTEGQKQDVYVAMYLVKRTSSLASVDNLTHSVDLEEAFVDGWVEARNLSLTGMDESPIKDGVFVYEVPMQIKVGYEGVFYGSRYYGVQHHMIHMQNFHHPVNFNYGGF